MWAELIRLDERHADEQLRKFYIAADASPAEIVQAANVARDNTLVAFVAGDVESRTLAYREWYASMVDGKPTEFGGRLGGFRARDAAGWIDVWKEWRQRYAQEILTAALPLAELAGTLMQARAEERARRDALARQRRTVIQDGLLESFFDGDRRPNVSTLSKLGLTWAVFSEGAAGPVIYTRRPAAKRAVSDHVAAGRWAVLAELRGYRLSMPEDWEPSQPEEPEEPEE